MSWKRVQLHLGIPADGIAGPVTCAAVKEALGIQATPQKRQANLGEWPRESEARVFYGEPGTNQTQIELPYPMRLDWSLQSTIYRMTCHELVADSLTRIFEKTLERYGEERIVELGLDRFAGCLNVRPKRGGSSWSMHAFGAAVDLYYSQNQLRWNKQKALFAKSVYRPFWSIVEGEGWVSLGRSKDYDWCHFQAARFG